MANASKAFEIIIQHFSGQTLCQSQEAIYTDAEFHGRMSRYYDARIAVLLHIHTLSQSLKQNP